MSRLYQGIEHRESCTVFAEDARLQALRCTCELGKGWPPAYLKIRRKEMQGWQRFDGKILQPAEALISTVTRQIARVKRI